MNVLIANKNIVELAYDDNDNKLDSARAKITITQNRVSAVRSILRSRKFLSASVYVLSNTSRKKKANTKCNHSLNETIFVNEIVSKL